MSNLLFRPQSISKKFTIRARRKGNTFNYNFVNRTKWYPVGWGFNKKVLGGIFGRLHYLACHAPIPVQKRYRSSYRALEARLIPRKASIRYIEKYTAGAWL